MACRVLIDYGIFLVRLHKMVIGDCIDVGSLCTYPRMFRSKEMELLVRRYIGGTKKLNIL